MTPNHLRSHVRQHLGLVTTDGYTADKGCFLQHWRGSVNVDGTTQTVQVALRSIQTNYVLQVPIHSNFTTGSTTQQNSPPLNRKCTNVNTKSGWMNEVFQLINGLESCWNMLLSPMCTVWYFGSGAFIHGPLVSMSGNHILENSVTMTPSIGSILPYTCKDGTEYSPPPSPRGLDAYSGGAEPAGGRWTLSVESPEFDELHNTRSLRWDDSIAMIFK